MEQVLNSRVAQPGVTPSGLYRAPGAPDVFVEDGVYYLTYHAYRPVNTLGIRPMNWHDGWPYFNEPGGGPYDLRDRGYYRLVNQDGIISEPDSLQNPEASDRCLTAAPDGNVVQRDCDGSLEQIWELQAEDDGFWRFRAMSETAGHCLKMSDGSGRIGTNVTVWAAKWPPQQWLLSMVGMTPDLLLAAFDGFVEDGRIVGHGPGASGPGRLGAVRNMLVSAFGRLEAGDVDAGLTELSNAQARVHVGGAVTPAHFVTGDDADTLHGLIEQLKEAQNGG